MSTAWVVIPTYNERLNLPAVIARAQAAVETVRPGVSFDFLVVDDASPDGTGAVADALAGEREGVHVLHRRAKEGLGPAYVAGFRHALAAGADFVLQMDADFSHDPADLARLFAAAREGADVAVGSRYVEGGAIEGWARHRLLLSRAGGIYARRLLGVGVRDLTAGFKCFRARALHAVDLDSLSADGYAFQVEVTYRAVRRGLRVVEVPIVFRERRLGQSKMSKAIAVEALWRIPRMREPRSSAPMLGPAPA